MAELISINIGKKKIYKFENREIETALIKQSISGDIFTGVQGLVGDEQSDLVHHGGIDKAVCFYPFEHYEYWNGKYGNAIPENGFGENISLKGLLETDVCIGDIYHIGDVLFEITQPRQPCYKLSLMYKLSDIVSDVEKSLFTGYYARILRTGKINVKNTVTLIKRHPQNITVHFAGNIMYHDRKNKEAMKKILAVEELSKSWRNSFEKMLSGINIDTEARTKS